jgi:hypothetical protein
MTPPDSTPKLPQWAFFVADAVLLATAWYLARHGGHPLPPSTVIAVVVCVIVGAILGTLPLLARYEREKNEALDERQRALESLSRTVAASAEQISIAANGLHEIAELAHRNLKSAEQLPHKLQDKIAEFKAELENTNAEEREELEKELATLRAGESERLESTADKIAKAVTDFTKLESTVQKSLAAATDAVAKASSAADQAVAKTQAAVAGIDQKLAGALSQIEARSAAAPKPAAAPSAPPARPSEPAPKPESARPASPPEPRPAPAPTPIASVVVSTSPAKTASAPASPKTESVAPVATTPPPSAKLSAPVPAPSATTATPITVLDAPSASTNGNGDHAASATAEATVKTERKRAPKKPRVEAPDEAALPLEEPEAVPAKLLARTSPPDDFAQIAPDEAAPQPAVSADGATRLLVTAYIGIGNRLFIRGEGPGLNWEKGVPLQFVSIGKWRWETAEATRAIRFKLYKNDELECAAVGLKTLDPGHQQEVTAAF